MLRRYGSHTRSIRAREAIKSEVARQFYEAGTLRALCMQRQPLFGEAAYLMSLMSRSQLMQTRRGADAAYELGHRWYIAMEDAGRSQRVAIPPTSELERRIIGSLSPQLLDQFDWYSSQCFWHILIPALKDNLDVDQSNILTHMHLAAGTRVSKDPLDLIKDFLGVSDSLPINRVPKSLAERLKNRKELDEIAEQVKTMRVSSKGPNRPRRSAFEMQGMSRELQSASSGPAMRDEGEESEEEESEEAKQRKKARGDYDRHHGY